MLSEDYSVHFADKIQKFKELWAQTLAQDLPKISLFPSPQLDIRDKADFICSYDFDKNEHTIGFYNPESKVLEDIKEYALFTKNLQTLYTLFREFAPRVKKGSVRIRVSPQNKKGLWLDFANTDVRDLLSEKTQLQKLLKIFDIIEIGQKRKILDPNSFKLIEPKPYPWFETYIEQKPIPLYCNVASFTQTGFAPNKVLVSAIETIIENLNIQTWFEACSGSGNFTLPLANKSQKVIATELDDHAIENVQETLTQLQKNADYKNLNTQIEFHSMNIHKESAQLLDLLNRCDGIFVDPPRSGLQDFTNMIAAVKQKPQCFLYVSCYYQSMISDIQKLASLGYKPVSVTAVDQFPFSDHCEWITLLKLK